ncbi:uncharacterized protein [Littorina saxatilis]|uniref:Uncharacterized protein n=1 Tax=Littorina saxatilis TaxID=31220 RepID=A0AAN9ANQ3_9CAEN
MKVVIAVVVVVALVGSACAGPLQRTKRWSVHSAMREAAPGLTGLDLVDVLASAPDIRYTDWTKHLTAIKNSKFKACFITNLDPGFNLAEPEMEKITTEKVPDTVTSPQDVWYLRQKAGSYISPMCQQVDIYWLNAIAPPHPQGNKPAGELPQPIRVKANNSPLPITDRRAPPPVNVFRSQLASQNNVPKAPPPVSFYHQELANQNVPHIERVPQTPPPLALWKQ